MRKKARGANASSSPSTSPPEPSKKSTDLRELYRHARIPPRYWDAELPDKASLKGFAHNLRTNMVKGIGLLLTGQHGTGKTWTACALAKKALAINARVLYIDAPSLVQVYIDRPMFDEDLTMPLALMTRKLLVIDDLGSEYRGSGSGHSESRILALIRFRIQHNLCTVITTNLTPEDLGRTYGEGFASLLQEALVTIPLNGKDWRRENRDRLLEESGVKSN